MPVQNPVQQFQLNAEIEAQNIQLMGQQMMARHEAEDQEYFD